MSNLIHPLGWEAGREGEPPVILKMLSMEMMGHASDLRHEADRTKDSLAKFLIEQQATQLEKYAIALYALAVQMNPTGYRPENMGGLIELAKKHNLVIPDWMKGEPK